MQLRVKKLYHFVTFCKILPTDNIVSIVSAQSVDCFSQSSATKEPSFPQSKAGESVSRGFNGVTVDVVAVIEVLVVERRTGRHQLLQPHLGDEEAAGQVEVLQRGKPTTQ